MNRKQKMKAALDNLFTSPNTRETIIEKNQVISDPKTDEILFNVAMEEESPKVDRRQIDTAPQKCGAAVMIEEQQAVKTWEDVSIPSATIMKEPEQAGKPRQEKTIPREAGVDQAASQVERHLVVFQLCDEFYGVDISLVESIIKVQSITTVPHTPPFVQGVTNLRGTVLPVFDLRKRFDLDAKMLTKDSRIVVVRNHGNSLGMIVDSVAEVLQVPVKACEPTPKLVSTIDSSYISGIARTEDQLVILLDLDRVLRVQQRGNGTQ